MIKKKHNELKIKVIGIGDCGIGAIGKINSSDSVDTIAIYRHFFFNGINAKYCLEIRENCRGLDGSPEDGEEAAENSKEKIIDLNLPASTHILIKVSGSIGDTRIIIRENSSTGVTLADYVKVGYYDVILTEDLQSLWIWANGEYNITFDFWYGLNRNIALLEENDKKTDGIEYIPYIQTVSYSNTQLFIAVKYAF